MKKKYFCNKREKWHLTNVKCVWFGMLNMLGLLQLTRGILDHIRHLLEWSTYGCHDDCVVFARPQVFENNWLFWLFLIVLLAHILDQSFILFYDDSVHFYIPTGFDPADCHGWVGSNRSQACCFPDFYKRGQENTACYDVIMLANYPPTWLLADFKSDTRTPRLSKVFFSIFH